MYRLNPERYRPGEDQERNRNPPESEKTHFIGKAGEYLVAGRLIFMGYNASILSVDEGIDIVAIKEDKLYNIQVKTANGKSGKYVAGTNVSSYQRNNAGNTFYVFVLREKNEEKYVILPFTEMQKNIALKNILTVDKGKRYRANFTLRDGKMFLGNLKNDITFFVDNWGLIV